MFDNTFSKHKIRLLLVDEDTTFIRLAERYLSSCDEMVLIDTACEPREGMAKATRLRPDVLLVDVNTPRSKLIPMFRVSLPEMGVVAVTPVDGVGDRQAALRAGADDLVSKLQLTRELLPAIRRAAEAADRRHQMAEPS